MKLLHVALWACALSACAIDDEDDLQATTQQVRPVPPFEVTMGLDGGCSQLNIVANWTSQLFNATSIEYTLTDLTNKNEVPFTSFFSLGTTTISVQLGFLQPLTKGAHRLRVDAELIDLDGGVIDTDSFKDRFPCSLPLF